MKKVVFIVLLGLLFLIVKTSGRSVISSYCAFCDPKVLQKQVFYEEELVYALYTHKPVVPGHCLIIPKRHVERFEELSKEEIAQIAEVIKKVNLAVQNVFSGSFHTTSYFLLQKNGKEAGQTVPHVHFHYVPRERGGNLLEDIAFLMQMVAANFFGPISDETIQEIVQKMHKEMKVQDQTSQAV